MDDRLYKAVEALLLSLAGDNGMASVEAMYDGHLEVSAKDPEPNDGIITELIEAYLEVKANTKPEPKAGSTRIRRNLRSGE